MTSITDTAFIHMATSTDADTDANRRQAVWHVIGAVQKLAHTFLEITDTTSLKSQDPLFAAGGCHDCLWPKATRFLMSLDV